MNEYVDSEYEMYIKHMEMNIKRKQEELENVRESIRRSEKARYQKDMELEAQGLEL